MFRFEFLWYQIKKKIKSVNKENNSYLFLYYYNTNRMRRKVLFMKNIIIKAWIHILIGFKSNTVIVIKKTALKILCPWIKEIINWNWKKFHTKLFYSEVDLKPYPQAGTQG